MMSVAYSKDLSSYPNAIPFTFRDHLEPVTQEIYDKCHLTGRVHRALTVTFQKYRSVDPMTAASFYRHHEDTPVSDRTVEYYEKVYPGNDIQCYGRIVYSTPDRSSPLTQSSHVIRNKKFYVMTDGALIWGEDAPIHREL